MVTARRRQGSQVVQAICSPTDQVGDAVYANGQAGGFYQVARVDITLTNKMPAIGIITKKWDSTKVLVQLWGEVTSVYSELTPGRTYFVDHSGRPSTSPPVAAPGNYTYQQVIGVALDMGTLLVKPSETLFVLVA